jgi:glycosyltransferase involved in cell wall biosynthesis
VRYLVNTTQPGAAGSRNFGAAHASGDALAFLDDDDVWRPAYLARAGERLQASGLDVVVSGICRLRQDGATQAIVMPARIAPSALLDRNPGLTGSNVVIRRAAFERIGGFDARLPVMNDWDFLIRLLAGGTEYAVVDDLLVEWREHEGERISTPTTRRASGIEAFIAKHRGSMSERQHANLASEALGIRRRRSDSLVEKCRHALALIHLLGLREVVRRRLARVRTAFSGAR